MNKILLAIGLVLFVLTLGPARAADASKPAPTAPLPPKRVLLDLSTESMIDAATARRILDESIPARVWKLYPATKWGFVSEVEGGFTEAKVCVVTARVFLAPLTAFTKGVVMRPTKRATTFDALPGATQKQCRDLAELKLREAANVVVSSLVKS